jgi:N-acyl-D-amino-acid deacylase
LANISLNLGKGGISMLDTVIVGGEVIDGSGAPARRVDVGIKGDRVVKIGIVDESAHDRRLGPDHQSRLH